MSASFCRISPGSFKLFWSGFGSNPPYDLHNFLFPKERGSKDWRRQVQKMDPLEVVKPFKYKKRWATLSPAPLRFPSFVLPFYLRQVPIFYDVSEVKLSSALCTSSKCLLIGHKLYSFLCFWADICCTSRFQNFAYLFFLIGPQSHGKLSSHPCGET